LRGARRQATTARTMIQTTTRSPAVPPHDPDEPLRPYVTQPRDDLLNGLRHWELWGRLGWYDVKRRYRRTIIGPYWGAISLAVFVLAVGVVGAGLWNQDLANYLPFLAAGMIVWAMISTNVTEACNLFVSGANFFRQMRLDYSVLVYSMVWRNLITFSHNLSVYVLVILIFAPHTFGLEMLLALPGLVLVAINSVWIALVLGMVCLRFRDIQPLVASVIQISMFVTPIFWSPDTLSSLRRLVFVTLNPLYHLIDVVRSPLLGRVPAQQSYIAVLIITVVGWTLAYLVFRRFRSRIPYWS
jgi:ABC-type polysaccharide/polyol phosphate export permease